VDWIDKNRLKLSSNLSKNKTKTKKNKKSCHLPKEVKRIDAMPLFFIEGKKYRVYHGFRQA